MQNDLYRARITGIGASEERKQVQEEKLSKVQAGHAKVSEHVTHNMFQQNCAVSSL